MSTIAFEPSRSPTSRFIPWLFVAGMLLVIAVNGVLIFFATTTWSGLATGHAYEQGLAYNTALAAQAKQDALGWTFDVRLQPAAGGASLLVGAGAADGWVLSGLTVEAVLQRPLGDADTRRVMLSPVAEGLYAAALAPLAPGQWDVHLTVSRGDQHARVSRRLIAP